MGSSVVETINDGRTREKERSVKEFYNLLKKSLEKNIGGESQPGKGELLGQKHGDGKGNMTGVWHLIPW